MVVFIIVVAVMFIIALAAIPSLRKGVTAAIQSAFGLVQTAILSR